MNIQPSLDPTPNLPQDIAVARSSGPPAGAGSPSAVPIVADGDATHLSPAAVLAAASSSLPEVRADKVAGIQQALASGSYAVSPSDVAGKLIDHLLQS